MKRWWPRLVGGPASESYRIYAVAGALLAAGPVWHYLYVNRYPPRVEFFLLVGGAALLGALAAVVAHRVGGAAESVGFAALLLVFVDLQLDLDTWPWWLLLGIAVALSLLLRRRRAAITAVALGAFYLASLPRSTLGGGTIAFAAAPGVASAAPPSASGARPPVLLHVVLDEEWGIGGLRHEGDSATAAFLTDFYERRGFELYPAAYSRHHRTLESLPAILSLGQPPALDTAGAKPFVGTLPTIPYFAALRASGYTIHVFQSTYLNYCAAPATPVASCETQSGNSIANIGYLGGSTASRAKLAGRYLLDVTSRVYRHMHSGSTVRRRSSAGGGVETLHHVRDAIAAGSRPGTAYFVHVLLPHRPLEVEPDCGVLKDPTKRVGYDVPAHLSDAAWTARLQRESSQIRCAHLVLGAVLDALDRTVDRDHAIVIVHGDHGARINKNSPLSVALSHFDDAQLNSYYSTLLAVRRPGVPAAVHDEPVPVQDFVWRLARQGFRGSVPGDYVHFVHAAPTDANPSDSVRLLTAAQMPWSARSVVTARR